MSARGKSLKEFAKLLREDFPTHKPVKVYRCMNMPWEKGIHPYSKRDGDCSDYPKYFMIRVNGKRGLGEQKEILMHEWAHAVVGWEEGKEHTDQWGKQYARIYRKMVDE